MSLTVIFVVACVYILVRDRKDWVNYVVVVLATLFFAGTNLGNDIGPWMIARAGEFDQWVLKLFS